MVKRKEGFEGPGSEEKKQEQGLIKTQEIAAAYLKDCGLGEKEQTKITLFLQSTLFANSVIFPKVEHQIQDWFSYKFFHQQMYKNAELITLLTRVTKWTFDPFVYMKYWQIAPYLMTKVDLLKHFALNFAIDDTGVQFYNFLAFSHALMSEIRIRPLVLDLPEDDYIGLLYEIEEENGRQIQLQVRLLKAIEVPLSLDEKEEIILSERDKVKVVFRRFLEFLCEK